MRKYYDINHELIEKGDILIHFPGDYIGVVSLDEEEKLCLITDLGNESLEVSVKLADIDTTDYAIVVHKYNISCYDEIFKGFDIKKSVYEAYNDMLSAKEELSKFIRTYTPDYTFEYDETKLSKEQIEQLAMLDLANVRYEKSKLFAKYNLLRDVYDSKKTEYENFLRYADDISRISSLD